MSKEKGQSSTINSLEIRSQESAFEDVYKDYYERLFAYALVITNSEALAQDAVSDVFYNLWNKKKDLSSIKELKSYLFASIKNQAIKYLAQDPSHFYPDEHERAILSVDQVNPEELLLGKELESFIDAAIGNLPDQCGLVFRLVKEKNLNYQEVSEELGISPYTVKYHMETALKKIKSELNNHFSESKVIKWISTGSIALILSNWMLSLI